MLEDILPHTVGGIIADGIVVLITYALFTRKKKVNLENLRARTITKCKESLNSILDIVLDEILVFLYLSKAIKGEEITALMETRMAGLYTTKFRNELLRYLNTDEVFSILRSMKEVPDSFWIPVLQGLRTFDAKIARNIDTLESTESFAEVNYLTELSDLSEQVLKKLSLLGHKRQAGIAGINPIEQVFDGLQNFISKCLESDKMLRTE